MLQLTKASCSSQVVGACQHVGLTDWTLYCWTKCQGRDHGDWAEGHWPWLRGPDQARSAAPRSTRPLAFAWGLGLTKEWNRTWDSKHRYKLSEASSSSSTSVDLCLGSWSDNGMNQTWDSKHWDELSKASSNSSTSVDLWSILITAFIRTVTFKRGSSGSGHFTWYAQLDAGGIFHVFIYEWLFTRIFICCCLNEWCFMIGMNVWWMYLDTAKHSSCNCIDTWQ